MTSEQFRQKLSEALHWEPPDRWKKIRTVDLHTAGEPLRVILQGFPELTGDTILARRREGRERYDFLRTALMWEPRGHADMYGCIVTPPATPDADFGVLFIHNEGFSTMCGHGIIAVTRAVLELGIFAMQPPLTRLKIDTPAGRVTAFARIEAHRVKSVYFHNVPSFVLALDQTVTVPGLGKVTYDLAFGGAFYVFVQAQPHDLLLVPENFRRIIDSGMAIKRAVSRQRAVEHPFDPDLSFLYGTIFTGPPRTATGDSRNVCVFAEGEVDRSPTGTGVSARIAIHHLRGEIGLRQPLVIESLIDSTFIGQVEEVTRFATYPAVIPAVEGTAFITGMHEFYIDPEDPFKEGFILR